MIQITGSLLDWVCTFVLILIRISGLFVLSPIWGRANVPVTMKIGLSVLISFIMINLLPTMTMAGMTIWGFGVLCAGELLVGLVIGYLTTLFFSIVFTAGQIIDTQIGFGMVQVYDVQQNIQIPIAGSILNLVILLCFLLVGGHLRLIEILVHTYGRIPPGGVVISPAIATVAIEAFVQSFVLAVQVALPIIASGLLAEISLGIIVRTAPQMNVFVIGIPIKIIIGLVMLILIIPMFTSFTSIIFDSMFASIDSMFTVLAGG